MTDPAATTAAFAGLDRRHLLRAALVCVALALLSLVLTLSDHAGLYASVLLLGACFVVPLLVRWQQGMLDAFEPIHVVGLIYFCYFGLGAVWTVHVPGVAYRTALIPEIPRAAVYCLLGYAALLVGYFGPWFRGPVSRRRPIDRIHGPGFLLVVGGIGGLAYAAEAARDHVPAAVTSLAQLAPVLLFVWAVAWLLVFDRQANRAQRWTVAAFLVPVVLVVLFLTVSQKSLLMTILGIPMIAWWYVRRRLPWKTMVLLLLFSIFVVFPFYNTYRLSDRDLGRGERIGLTYQRIAGEGGEGFAADAIALFQRRMAMINSVAVVMQDVPRWMPHAHGATIVEPMLISFVPRVLWPGKPAITMGQDFGRLFRVTFGYGDETSIAASVPGELYWNFDLPGVLIGMALWGAAMRMLYRRFGPPAGMDHVRLSIWIVLLIQFAYFGGSIGPEIVYMLRTLILLLVLCWLARRAGLLRPDGGASPA